MKIGITTFGADGGKSGISQYVRETLRAFAALQKSGEAADVEFELIAHADEAEYFIPSPEWSVLTFPAELRSALPNLIWHQTRLPQLCKERKYDVLFLPAGNRRLPFHAPCPTVGAVFDFSLLHIPGKYDAAHSFYITKVLPILAQRLTRVVTLSDSSRTDIVDFAKVKAHRVTVIPAAADRGRFRPIDRTEARQRVNEKYGINAPYLLFVSRIEHPGKNHVRLIEAFARLKSENPGLPHQLVLAGSDWHGAAAVHTAAENSGFADQIKFTGFVASEDLPSLYSAADLTVFPSLYEGFGLPVLEAMQCGTPVACSRSSSLPEVGGTATAYFDPTISESIAHTIQLLLKDPDYLETMRTRGLARAAEFSWERSARTTLEILREAAATAKRSVPTSHLAATL